MSGGVRYITLVPAIISAVTFLSASFAANWQFGQALIPNTPFGPMTGIIGAELVVLKITIPFLVVGLWRNHHLSAVILPAFLWVLIFGWCWLGSCLGVYSLLATSSTLSPALTNLMGEELGGAQIRMAWIIAFYIELLSGFLPLIMVQGFSRSSQVANSAKRPFSDRRSTPESNIVQLPLSLVIAGSVKEFLNHRTELNEHGSVGASDLYVAFTGYCGECGITLYDREHATPCSQKLFGENMTVLKFERVRLGSKGRYHYRGVQLRQSVFDLAA